MFSFKTDEQLPIITLNIKTVIILNFMFLSALNLSGCQMAYQKIPGGY